MSDTLVTAGAVLVGPDGETISNGAVLVREDEIVAVGPLAQVRERATEATQEIAFPDTSTLLPGLIDSHVRLVLNGGRTPYQDLAAQDLSSDHARDEYLATMADRAESALRAGVTTLRDIGDLGGLAIKLAQHATRADHAMPRVVPAGSPLTTPGGDAAFLGGTVETDDDIRAAIADRAEAGAQLICYHDSGGWLRLAPGPPEFWDTLFSPTQVQLIVSEAQRHGLPVAAHVHSREGIAHAVEAGVHTIEQCTWSIGDEQFEREDSLADAMAKQEISVCIPSTARNRRGVIGKYGEKAAIDLWYSRYPWLDQHGVSLIAGTSAGSVNGVFNNPVGGLEVYEWMGFSPARIIDFATRNAAAALKLDETVGALAAGHSADLLVVDGDPLKDLQALRNVQFVMAAGRIAEGTQPQE